jgi:hypothetical protein
MPETRLCVLCKSRIPSLRNKRTKCCSSECSRLYRKQQRDGGKQLALKHQEVKAKTVGRVLVHHCLANEIDTATAGCRCHLTVTADEAEGMIADGSAVDFESRRATFVDRSILLVHVLKKTPRSAMIERAHCERAFIDENEEERQRIEIFGLLTLLARVQIAKSIQDETPQDAAKRKFAPLRYEPKGGRENDWGQPIISLFTDERTKGGVGTDVSLSPRENELEYETLESEEVPPDSKADSKADSDFVETHDEEVPLDEALPQEEPEEVVG